MYQSYSLNLQVHDFFEQSNLANRCILPHAQLNDSLFQQEQFLFEINPHSKNQQPFESDEIAEEVHELSGSSRDINYVDDTNHLEEFLGKNIEFDQEPLFQLKLDCQYTAPDLQQKDDNEQMDISINEPELVQIIHILIDSSNLSQEQISASFPFKLAKYSKMPIIITLIQKFRKLKKTKEELIKYCMRKAFKFILELPKNKHLLTSEKQQQKISLSKCKNRYLKKVSQEKSMNSKFLNQVFNEGDFAEDYQLFLQDFNQIMEEDNQKKIKYLAWLLTNQKQGKMRSVEMVKRLPWTKTILQKVNKISAQLLKFSIQR